MLMENLFTRTEWLIGEESIERLKRSNVLVVGLGGVGACAAEMLCRAGVGNITIADHDTISESNINRQLAALESTVGREKTEIMAQRLKDINSRLNVNAVTQYLKDEKIAQILQGERYDYVVDAIDTISPKVYLIATCVEKGIPIVSSMGSGDRLDPTMIHIADISQTFNCHLARMIRKKLHKLGIYEGVASVFSSETSENSSVREDIGENKRTNVGSISYMPAMFGCTVASVVIRELIGIPAYQKTKDKRYYYNKKSSMVDLSEYTSKSKQPKQTDDGTNDRNIL